MVMLNYIGCCIVLCCALYSVLVSTRHREWRFDAKHCGVQLYLCPTGQSSRRVSWNALSITLLITVSKPFVGSR
ncbi:hypothetical protein F4819DRAFT_474438 [Hypoxylon fuscum]|nr:hypothetical protein F4819DRAFT_474438 [Hypoxylon fuscum]